MAVAEHSKAIVPLNLRKPRRERQDHAFLAPDLEILETPPSPIGAALVLTICAFALTAIAWAYFGHIDIVATAEGKIEPLGKVRVVQPIQPGRVAAIPVHDGDRVVAGQVVAQFDTRDAQAQLDDAWEQSEAARAEMVRRDVVLSAFAQPTRQDADVIVVPTIPWASDIPQADREREEDILRKDVEALRTDVAALRGQIAQKNADLLAVSATISAQQDLDGTLSSLADMRETLMGTESGSRADWLAALEQLKTQQVALSADLKEKADDEAAIPVLKSQIDKVWADFLSDYSQKRAAAAQQVDELSHKLTLAQSARDALTLKSPIDGVVEASILTTLGQVIAAGAEVMRIVPSSEAFDVTAYLPNEDIGFVRVGQPVQIKVAAFPYSQYGVIEGTVVELGQDALPLGSATQSLGDPTQSAAGANDALSQGGKLVFPVRVELARTSIAVNGTAVPLQPGMSVSVDINTGNRRILDFLLSPIEDVGSGAMRER